MPRKKKVEETVLETSVNAVSEETVDLTRCGKCKKINPEGFIAKNGKRFCSPACAT